MSGDGHNWTTAAYAADYRREDDPEQLLERGRSVRLRRIEPRRAGGGRRQRASSGYRGTWRGRGQASVRNYGEFTRQTKDGRWVANKPWLAQCTDATYPGWD